nr:unnamed protein product [Callosobruchus analis]
MCLEDSVTPLSIFSFSRTMDDMNIGLFKPRKDQCDSCIAYKAKQLGEYDYQNHIRAKDDARNEKSADKKRAEEDLIYCFTMDVQAVMLCPKFEVSTGYYKTKLQVHNFTIYNLMTHQSKNFVWNESEGELCSSVFTTCIIKHLESYLDIEVKPTVLWSDSCGYQNKNSILSNALSLLATRFNVTIEQKYLEKGNTQMESNSTHSLIERRLKGKYIYLPTDYINIIKDARRKPFSLDVEYLSHSFFLNYEDPNCKRYNSIRPGNKKNDLKVNDLKCLKYESTGEIHFKSSYTESYVLLPQRQKPIDVNYTPKGLYEGRLKIKKKKWNHLQQFKGVMTTDVHFFYDALQYEEGEDEAEENELSTNIEAEAEKLSVTGKTENVADMARRYEHLI